MFKKNIKPESYRREVVLIAGFIEFFGFISFNDQEIKKERRKKCNMLAKKI